MLSNQNLSMSEPAQVPLPSDEGSDVDMENWDEVGSEIDHVQPVSATRKRKRDRDADPEESGGETLSSPLKSKSRKQIAERNMKSLERPVKVKTRKSKGKDREEGEDRNRN